MSRPFERDVVRAENESVYASDTFVGGVWLGALFSKRDIGKGEVIAEYEGKVYDKDEADSVPNQEYMMAVRDPSDRRRRVFVDGNPSLHPFNIAGWANFAEGKSANAVFEDMASLSPPEKRSHVFLVAREPIPTGTEVRVDYDGGSSAHPFRDQMVRQGIPLSTLRSPEYKALRWLYPSSVRGTVPAVPIPASFTLDKVKKRRAKYKS